MPIRFDTSARPILQIAYQGTITDGDVRTHVDELDAAIRDWDAPFYMCIEIDGVNVEPPARETLMAWGKRFEAEYVGKNIGVAFATSSRIARGVIRSLHWVARPRYPWEILGSHAKAFEWCRARSA
jgi:hypothetical protein